MLPALFHVAPTSAWLTPRRRAVAAMAAAVLLLHAAVLALLPRTVGPGWRDVALGLLPPRPVQLLPVQLLPVPVAAAADDVAEATAPVTTPPVHKAMPANAAPQIRADPATAPAAQAAAANSDDADSDAGMPAAAQPQADPGALQVPVYATRLPPPLTLQYALRRAGQNSVAELRWQPAGDGSYTLSLHGSAVRGSGLAWDSTGGVDAHGIAPLRYTESRRGRPQRAVNFQRDPYNNGGRITFSGPQTEHPLPPGAQDRLSWMLQLPAVLAANPALAAPGSQVLLFVAGTRGDAEVWAFDVLGDEAVELPDSAQGPLQHALHLRRQPRRPYDTFVDVWLDPARHHLPVRALLALRPGGVDVGGSELVLQALRLP